MASSVLGRSEVRKFLEANPGAAWHLRGMCILLLAGEPEDPVRRLAEWLKSECEAYAEERGHLA